MSWAALVTSVAALVMATTGLGTAGTSPRGLRSVTIRLSANGRIPARLLPTVARARNAEQLDGMTAAKLVASCPTGTVDIGTWCLDEAPFLLTSQQTGLNNYFFATQACENEGGYLPTAAQLIGAAAKASLESVINDNPKTATVDTDPTNGLKDQREMSATLVTTAAGSDAAGSEGVTAGSTGNPMTGEPDPNPEPAVPSPETLQYVTVYDNFNKGGFAGSEPVSAPENFRCAFDKVPRIAGSGSGPGSAGTNGSTG
jgi:hypothetical protein